MVKFYRIGFKMNLYLSYEFVIYFPLTQMVPHIIVPHFIVSTDIINVSDKNFKTYTSDHIPLKIQITFSDFNFLFKSPNHSVSFKNTDWNTFKIDISNLENYL